MSRHPYEEPNPSDDKLRASHGDSLKHVPPKPEADVEVDVDSMPDPTACCVPECEHPAMYEVSDPGSEGSLLVCESHLTSIREETDVVKTLK